MMNYETKQKRNIQKITISTNKSILLKFATLQFLGMTLLAIVAIVIAVIAINNNSTTTIETKTVVDQAAVEQLANDKFEAYKEAYQPETITVTETVEVEKIVEVEKPVEVIRTETVEVPVETVVEREVVRTIEVPVETVITQTVTVVDQEAVQQLATEMATQMYNAFKEAYVAQADEEATSAAIAQATASIQAEYTAKMQAYIAQADAEKVTTLATEMAQQMFEQFKADYIVTYAAEQEATRVANVSTISIVVILPDGTQKLLQIEGSLHDELTWDIIKAALEADERFNGYKIKSITNKEAVEVFVGRNFTSTRVIKLANK